MSGQAGGGVRGGIMKPISRVQYVSQGNTPAEHLLNIKTVCGQGVDWVQLRLKNITADTYIETAGIAKGICEKYGAKLIINDNVDVAFQIGADGVHLGKTDMSCREARKILGVGIIIGGTANTLEDCIQLYDEGVDYIGLGPFCFTTTKKNLSPILGIEGYQEIMRGLSTLAVSIPVIAIGGIQVSDVMELLKAGVHGIAVSGALTNTKNVKEAVENFQRQLLSGQDAILNACPPDRQGIEKG